MQQNLKIRATQEERRHEARRRLRKAALYLFATKGYDGVTLGAISLEAGFSRTLAQYHYDDKKSLALELLRDRIVRDNHIQLIERASPLKPEEAWQALLNHVDTLKNYYLELHAGTVPNIDANGEMAIHAAAFISKDPDFRACVEDQARDQVARIARLLESSRTGGIIPPSSDVRALAVLYVQSIWGLAQALYTSPFARKSISQSFDQLSVLLNALSCSEQAQS